MTTTETLREACPTCDRVECPHLPYERMDCDDYVEEAMSPPIQGDGGRLAWRDVSDGHGQVWVADFGPFRAEVWWSGIGWPWQVGLATIRHEGVAVALAREVRFVESTETLDAAQAAAEDAARDLLCSALAAFAGPEAQDVAAYWKRDDRPDRVLLKFQDCEYVMEVGYARDLGIALLSASQAVHPGRPAGEEGTPGTDDTGRGA